MKQVLGMVWFSLAMLCIVILLSFGNSKAVSVETEEEWVILEVFGILLNTIKK